MCAAVCVAVCATECAGLGAAVAAVGAAVGAAVWGGVWRRSQLASSPCEPGLTVPSTKTYPMVPSGFLPYSSSGRGANLYCFMASLASLAVSFWIAICFAFSLLVAKAGSGAKSAAPRLRAVRLLATARPSTCGDQAEGSANNESIFGLRPSYVWDFRGL